MSSFSDFKKIKQVLEFVWNSKHSSFYRKKYTEAGIHPLKDITSWEDFKKLPYLTKDELLKTDPAERLYIERSKANHLLITSGTTQVTEPLILLTQSDTYSSLNLKEGVLIAPKVKRPLILLPPLQMSNPLRLLQKLNKKGAELFYCLGDIRDLPLSAKVAKASSIDSIFTTPSGLYFFLPHLEKVYNLSRIQYLSLRGEYCSQTRMALFKRKFPKALFEFDYGSSETGKLGYRCSALNKKPSRLFHPVPFFHFELSEENCLVITSLTTTGRFPLVRYLTSDVAAIREYNCSCPNRYLMETKGRIGSDIAKFSGVTLYALFIEQALKHYSQFLDPENFQAHIYEKLSGGKITNLLKIQLLPKENKNLDYLKENLKENLAKNIYLSSKLTLSDLIKQGVFSSLEVEFVKNFEGVYKQKRIVSHIR